jgi:aminodeoxyfutalosine deaminase
MTPSDADAASELDSLITALPKAELHIHLEGSIRPATLITLARRVGVDLGCKGEAEVLDMLRFRDLRHFGELYDACTHALGRPEDFALVTEELGRDAPSRALAISK